MELRLDSLKKIQYKYYIMTHETENKKQKDDDQLSQNYFKMNETGKEKLKEISEKILDIWNVVNEKKELNHESTFV